MKRKLLYLLRRFEKTIIFSIKALLMISIFAVYFGAFSFLIEQLQRFSRTSVISFVTFGVSIVLFMRIYGGFSVGVHKSKTIVNAMSLAVLMTNIVTFIQIYIMGVSSAELDAFTVDPFIGGAIWENIPKRDFLHYYLTQEVFPGLILLIAVFLMQLLLINIFTYLGNYVYFRINRPAKSLIIYDDEKSLPLVAPKINKYKKQWRINKFIRYNDLDIKNAILSHNSVFFLDIPRTQRNQLVEYCYAHNKNIYISPDVSDIILHNSNRVVVDDTTLFEITTRGMSFEQIVIKRLCDIALSFILTLLTSPIMIISAIIIKTYDGGPVLYKQPRLTKGARQFNVLKFRSMIVDAEKHTGAMLASENDNRITSVGKILRRLRIDELPQLLNILKGDMSIVGPRPERMEIAEEYEKEFPEFRYRLKVPAGLTGLAQIMSKYNTTPKDKLALDLEYIEQYSIWLDIQLILQTLIVFFKKDSTEGIQEEED